MLYPSLLTVWDGAAESQSAIDLAIRLAGEWDSHLDIACLGVDRTPTGFYAAEMAHEIAFDFYEQAKTKADENVEAARKAVSESALRHTIRPAACRFGELNSVIGKAAWFQDLTVLSKPYGRVDEELAEAVLEAALFSSPAPVLVAPSGETGMVGKRILLAWNGSLEAVRALRAALPLMAGADHVEAATVDAESRRSENADMGVALGAMLSRHGVDAEISRLTEWDDGVTATILGRARQIDADLIVMGAYSHSRLRERLLGGATRSMLKDADIPVLFAR